MGNPGLRSRAPRAVVTFVTVAALGVVLGGSAVGDRTGSVVSSEFHWSSAVVAPVRAAGVVVPVRAGVVPDHLNPGLLAARTHAKHDAEAQAALAAKLPTEVRELAAVVLAGLPGGSAVEIAWNHPDIGNHLGGVRLDEPTVMMLNSHRFEAQPERVAATVKHEIGHYYQGAVIAAHADAAGGWWDAYWQLDAALEPVFGKAWMERSADCVALHLGADWTHYTSACSATARTAVEALVAGRMP